MSARTIYVLPSNGSGWLLCSRYLSNEIFALLGWKSSSWRYRDVFFKFVLHDFLFADEGFHVSRRFSFLWILWSPQPIYSTEETKAFWILTKWLTFLKCTLLFCQQQILEMSSACRIALSLTFWTGQLSARIELTYEISATTPQVSISVNSSSISLAIVWLEILDYLTPFFPVLSIQVQPVLERAL